MKNIFLRLLMIPFCILGGISAFIEIVLIAIGYPIYWTIKWVLTGNTSYTKLEDREMNYDFFFEIARKINPDKK